MIKLATSLVVVLSLFSWALAAPLENHGPPMSEEDMAAEFNELRGKIFALSGPMMSHTEMIFNLKRLVKLTELRTEKLTQFRKIFNDYIKLATLDASACSKEYFTNHGKILAENKKRANPNINIVAFYERYLPQLARRCIEIRDSANNQNETPIVSQ